MQMVPVYLGMDDYSDSIRVCVMTEDGEELLNRSVPSEPGCGCELHTMQETQEKPAGVRTGRPRHRHRGPHRVRRSVGSG